VVIDLVDYKLYS